MVFHTITAVLQLNVKQIKNISKVLILKSIIQFVQTQKRIKLLVKTNNIKNIKLLCYHRIQLRFATYYVPEPA